MKRYRYFIITMIVIMTMINYIDRGAISYAQEDIIKEFGFDTIAWGSILGYFGYGYMFGSLLGGITADKKGPKFVWILAGTAWSLVEIAMAFAGELGMAIFGGSAIAGFGLLRVLFGISEGPIFSTISKTNANWAAPRERGLLSALGFNWRTFRSTYYCTYRIWFLNYSKLAFTLCLIRHTWVSLGNYLGKGIYRLSRTIKSFRRRIK